MMGSKDIYAVSINVNVIIRILAVEGTALLHFGAVKK
jgi:hypothetical protein